MNEVTFALTVTLHQMSNGEVAFENHQIKTGNGSPGPQMNKAMMAYTKAFADFMNLYKPNGLGFVQPVATQQLTTIDEYTDFEWE